MAFVSTMILRSMRLIGEKTRGATLDSNEQVETLAELNTFMESLSLERLMCYTVADGFFTLTASTNSYTIGPGGAVNGLRPTEIVDPCFVRLSDGTDTPVKILNSEQYGRIISKSSGYTVPQYLYYDGGFSATSTATIYLYPSPAAGLTLHYGQMNLLQNFSTLSVQVLMPPGYQMMIESNFAIHLSAGYKPVSSELAKMARDSKAAVKGLNLPTDVMRLDSGVYGSGRTFARSTILTGS